MKNIFVSMNICQFIEIKTCCGDGLVLMKFAQRPGRSLIETYLVSYQLTSQDLGNPPGGCWVSGQPCQVALQCFQDLRL